MGMKGHTANIEETLALCERDAREQEERIAQQQMLITRLQNNDQTRLADDARQALADMTLVLAQIHRDLERSRKMLREKHGQIDGDKLEHMMRDGPL
jgi:hypothetical protein